jgi:hypothetical protein
MNENMNEDSFEFPDEIESKKTKKDDSDEKFELEIEDDTPPEDRGRKAAPPPEDPTDEELATYDERVQARIKKFTRGYHDERRAKEAAERERIAAEDFAKHVYEENRRLKSQLKTGSEAYIETSKSAAQSDIDSAKRRLKEAFEAGDAEALASAQEDIARATMKSERVAAMKPVEIEDNFKEAAPVNPPVASRRTQQWVDSNKDWFGKDEEMTMSAMGLDKKLQREYGSDYIGSKEYFQTIDTQMRKRFPEYFEIQSDEDDEPSKKVEPAYEETPRRAKTNNASPVAPASRSTPPSRVKLKESQVALARKLGITPEQYAKQVAILNRGE